MIKYAFTKGIWSQPPSTRTVALSSSFCRWRTKQESKNKETSELLSRKEHNASLYVAQCVLVLGKKIKEFFFSFYIEGDFI